VITRLPGESHSARYSSRTLETVNHHLKPPRQPSVGPRHNIPRDGGVEYLHPGQERADTARHRLDMVDGGHRRRIVIHCGIPSHWLCASEVVSGRDRAGSYLADGSPVPAGCSRRPGLAVDRAGTVARRPSGTYLTFQGSPGGARLLRLSDPRDPAATVRRVPAEGASRSFSMLVGRGLRAQVDAPRAFS
jgi:hypothetical protein